ncbi:hypothetical protein SprV_0501758700 [Sparganum proliferum]
MDDTFVVIEWDRVIELKDHLNAIFPDIQFTMEEEKNNQMAFFDVLVCRKDCDGLKTKANGYPGNFVNQCLCKRDERRNLTGPKFWQALRYVKNISEAVSRLLTHVGIGAAHKSEAPDHEAERLIATARSIWGCSPSLLQLRAKQLRQGNRKTTADANGRARNSGEEKRRQLPSRGSFDWTQQHIQV